MISPHSQPRRTVGYPPFQRATMGLAAAATCFWLGSQLSGCLLKYGQSGTHASIATATPPPYTCRQLRPS